MDAWETKNHFLWLVAHNKAQLIYIEVCSNMIEKGYSLSAIAEIVPKVSKADIYGLSHMLKMPIELTAEEREAVEKEYRKTGRPDVLKDILVSRMIWRENQGMNKERKPDERRCDSFTTERFCLDEKSCDRLIEIMKKTEPAKKIQNTGKYEEGKRLLKEYFGR